MATRQRTQRATLAAYREALETISSYALAVYTAQLEDRTAQVVEFASADYLRTLATDALNPPTDER